MSSIAASGQPNQSFIESLSNICDTSYGAFTLQKTVCKTARFICTFESLPKKALLVASKTATLFSICLTGFVIRDVSESFRTMVTSLWNCVFDKKTEKMTNDDWNKKRKENLLEASHSVFDFVYNFGDIVDLAHTVSLIGLSNFAQTVFGYVANSASLVADSLDIVKNIIILSNNWSNRSDDAIARKKLATIYIISDVASIALTIIAIGNIYVGASLCAARAIMTARKLHAFDLVYLSLVWTGLIYEERRIKQYDASKVEKNQVDIKTNLVIA